MKNIVILITTIFLVSCGATKTNTKKQNENLAKTKFGIEAKNLNDSIKKVTGLSHGIVIEKVFANGAANKGGLQKQDIIIKLDKNHILTLEEFNKIIENYRYTYGQVTIGIFRNNKPLKINLNLY